MKDGFAQELGGKSLMVVLVLIVLQNIITLIVNEFNLLVARLDCNDDR